jgi:hypothetical protein
VKIGIFLTGRHPPESDIVDELEGQYEMVVLAGGRNCDAVAAGHRYRSDGVRQVQVVPFQRRLLPIAACSSIV